MTDTVPRRKLKAHLTAQTDKWKVVTSEAWCPLFGYHVAATFCGRFEIDVADERTWASGAPIDSLCEWPTECDCGYAFGLPDKRVRLCFPVLRLPDGREAIYRWLPMGCHWDDMESD